VLGFYIAHACATPLLRNKNETTAFSSKVDFPKEIIIMPKNLEEQFYYT